MIVEHITRDNLPPDDWEHWFVFRKRVNTRMFWMPDKFTVETREGTLTRDSGWVAVDSDGYPYPIDPGVHEAMYEEVT